MKIYTNSYIHSEEITPENFTEVIGSYADKLEEVADYYRKLAKTIDSKNIKIVDAEGFASGGHFSVDEIDIGRLKKEGLVIDFAEMPSEENPVFYIDSELDQVLEETIDQLAEYDPDFEDMTDTILDKIYEEDRDYFKASDFLGDDLETKHIDIDFDDLPESTYEEFNLAEKLLVPDYEGFRPGDMAIEKKLISKDAMVFNLKMTDIGEPPIDISYDRSEGIFTYKCTECDASHLTDVESAYRSLKIASNIFSNLVEMTDYSELGNALNYIDINLRLLQWLVKLDYAIDDKDEME